MFALVFVCPQSTHPSSSLVFITRVTNDTISIHFRSDPTWHRKRVYALHCPQGIRSSYTTRRLSS